MLELPTLSALLFEDSFTGVSNGWGANPANQIRGYKNEVRLSPEDWLCQHGLQGLQPAAAGFVFVAAVSNRPSPDVGCAPALPF